MNGEISAYGVVIVTEKAKHGLLIEDEDIEMAKKRADAMCIKAFKMYDSVITSSIYKIGEELLEEIKEAKK